MNQQAITVHTETHHRLGLATAHLIAAKAGGHPTDHHATADALFAEIGAPLTGHSRMLRRAE